MHVNIMSIGQYAHQVIKGGVYIMIRMIMLSIEKLKNYSKHKSYLLLVAFKSEIFLLKEISIHTVMGEKNKQQHKNCSTFKF